MGVEVSEAAQLLLLTHLPRAGVYVGRFVMGIEEPRMWLSRDILRTSMEDVLDVAGYISEEASIWTLAPGMRMRDAYETLARAERTFAVPRFETPDALVYDRDHRDARIEVRHRWKALCSLAANTARYFDEGALAGVKQHRDLLGRIDRKSLDEHLLAYRGRDVYVTIKAYGSEGQPLAKALLGRMFAMFRRNATLADQLRERVTHEAKKLYT